MDRSTISLSRFHPALTLQVSNSCHLICRLTKATRHLKDRHRDSAFNEQLLQELLSCVIAPCSSLKWQPSRALQVEAAERDADSVHLKRTPTYAVVMLFQAWTAQTFPAWRLIAVLT